VTYGTFEMSATTDGDIREGFLCPDCQAQFPTHMQLESHYEVAHLTNPNEARTEGSTRNAINPLKDILGKARKILTNDDRSDTDQSNGIGDTDNSGENATSAQSTQVDEAEFYLMLREGQTIGFQKDLFETQFKPIREVRIERQVIETNKLLITLDKLLRGMPQGT
jgi:rabenosyn-5